MEAEMISRFISSKTSDISIIRNTYEVTIDGLFKDRKEEIREMSNQ